MVIVTKLLDRLLKQFVGVHDGAFFFLRHFARCVVVPSLVLNWNVIIGIRFLLILIIFISLSFQLLQVFLISILLDMLSIFAEYLSFDDFTNDQFVVHILCVHLCQSFMFFKIFVLVINYPVGRLTKLKFVIDFETDGRLHVLLDKLIYGTLV